MSKAKFLYPISDSGYDFVFDLLEARKEPVKDGIQLKIKYSLNNNHRSRFQIPIDIAHLVHLDCKRDENFEYEEDDVRIHSDRVLNLTTKTIMFGYGDDHHVAFDPGETREFLIIFPPVKKDFRTFDIEFLMKPDNDDRGEYRLRYDIEKGEVIKRFKMNEAKKDRR
jgi:hypothetical protein